MKSLVSGSSPVPLAPLALPLALALALAAPTGGRAQDAPAEPPPPIPASPSDTGRTLAFNLGVASDHVRRGLSRADGAPSVSAGVDVASGAVYAGAWGATVASPDGDGLELDLYAGVRPEAYGWSFDLGGLYVAYPDAPPGFDGYVEARAGASRSIGPFAGGVLLAWSPEFAPPGTAGDAGPAAYLELNAGYRLRPALVATGAWGRQTLRGDRDYSTWNLGLAYSLSDRLTLEGRYWDTDAGTLGEAADARATVGLKAVF